jgi:NAD(P)-dependent dehydrogenase (short-subunit alcohol dehydrogenase family)
VNVASGAHYQGQIHFEDINLEHGYNGWKAYCQSKLANVLFTYELVRRLDEPHITVNALTPGFVATRIGHNTGPILKSIVNLVQKMGGKTPEEGAKTIIYLASAPEVREITGRYFVEQQAVKSSLSSYDQMTAQRLWEISEMMVQRN